MAAINENILRTKFGFNDPNVIRGILSDPGQVARYEREYEGILNPGGGGGGGQTTASPSSALPSYQDVYAQQQKQQQDILGRYQQKIAGFTPLPTTYGNIQSQLGLPSLQQAALNLQNTVAALPETALQRAQNFGLSTGQMQEYQAGEAAKLAPVAQNVYSGLSAGYDEAARRLAATQAQQQMELLPITTEAEQFPGLASTLTGLWNTAFGAQASAEAQAASAKATQDLAELQAKLTAAQPITLSGGQTIYDPTTGKAIYTAPTKGTTGKPVLDLGDTRSTNNDPLGLFVPVG